MKPSGERTEKPTQRRVQRARREGQFASSRDFVSGLQFTVFVVLLAETGPRLFAVLRDVTRVLLGQAFRSDLGPQTLLFIVHEAFSQTLTPLAAAGGLLVATGLAFQLSSTKFAFSLHKLTPKAENFNFLEKLKGAPQRGFTSALQAIALLAVFGGILYWMGSSQINTLLLLPLRSLDTGLETVRSMCLDLMWKACAFFMFFGLVDLFRQKRRFAKQMRMTKQEVREDLKDSEGNPHTKVRIRRMQRDARRRRMMEEVKTATAVIVNPTHYAVAIRYHHESMTAPLVVAKGKNYLALRIRARAVEFQVPLVENPPLAQALYKSVDVGQHIPPHLYRAVAEILAYIYKLMGVKPG